MYYYRNNEKTAYFKLKERTKRDDLIEITEEEFERRYERNESDLWL